MFWLLDWKWRRTSLSSDLILNWHSASCSIFDNCELCPNEYFATWLICWWLEFTKIKNDIFKWCDSVECFRVTECNYELLQIFVNQMRSKMGMVWLSVQFIKRYSDTTTSDIILNSIQLKFQCRTTEFITWSFGFYFGFRSRILGNSVSDASQSVFFFNSVQQWKLRVQKGLKIFLFYSFILNQRALLLLFVLFFFASLMNTEHDQRHIHRWNNKTFSNCLFILSFFSLLGSVPNSVTGKKFWNAGTKIY